MTTLLIDWRPDRDGHWTATSPEHPHWWFRAPEATHFPPRELGHASLRTHHMDMLRFEDFVALNPAGDAAA